MLPQIVPHIITCKNVVVPYVKNAVTSREVKLGYKPALSSKMAACNANLQSHGWSGLESVTIGI